MSTLQSRVEQIVDVLQAAMQSPEVEAVLANLATDAVVVRGEQLANELIERERRIAAVSQRETHDLPDFAMYALIATSLLGVATIVQGVRTQNLRLIATAKNSQDIVPQCVVALAIVGYILALQFGNVDYRIATCVFILLVGGSLTRQRRQLWPAICVTSLLLSLGLHFVFTRVLVVDLP